MALDPWYSTYECDEYTKHLRAEAISDVLTLAPAEKRAKLWTYGLTPACRAVVNSGLRGMLRLFLGVVVNGPLLAWAAVASVVIKALEKPCFRPEAFRLERGCALWPTAHHVAVVIPLTTVKVSIDILPRGTNYAIPWEWDPGMVLFLNEMGMHFTGSGSVRFIYVLLRKDLKFRVRMWQQG